MSTIKAAVLEWIHHPTLGLPGRGGPSLSSVFGMQPKLPAAKDANAADGPGVLTALRAKESFGSISGQRWLALGAYMMGLDPKKRDGLATDFLGAGMRVSTLPDQREVTVLSDHGRVTIDMNENLVRVSEGTDSKVYRNGTLDETITVKDNGKYQVTRAGSTQIWDPNTGKGTLSNGKPIPVRYAANVPGEKPRKPWPRPLPNNLVEPTGDDSSPGFAKLYDEAVKKTGGQVVESLNVNIDNTQRYNCHSFATTGAHGNLSDPFDSTDQPRWVNFPTFELTNGAFKQLKSTQRVHPGDVIMYADEHGVPTHTGVVKEVDANGNPSKVESKWGAYGLYVHGPFDVPAIYGHIAGFWRPDNA